jgi:micrococcal nuclease
LSGSSVNDSKIQTDQKGNLQQDSTGNFITKVMRDKAGNVVPDGTTGAKYTDEYNCSDFATQTEAQAFYDKAGGVKADVNRLDANKDGIPCQSLPKGN